MHADMYEHVTVKPEKLDLKLTLFRENWLEIGKWNVYLK